MLHAPVKTGWGLILGLCYCSWVASLSTLQARPQYSHAQELFLAGNYQDCLDECNEAAELMIRGERWSLLTTQAYLETGQYQEATNAVAQAMDRYQMSVQLRVAAHEAYLSCGDLLQAETMLAEINELGSTYFPSYRDPLNRVALGQAALLMRADAKLVLQQFYEPAIKMEPELREPHLALGELALAKHDYELAAQTFSEAAKLFPKDPDVLFGVARAYANSDRERMATAITQALEINPRHIRSRLLVADRALDAEDYEECRHQLDLAEAVNPWRPEVWAYRAVLAHLDGDAEAEKDARRNAFQYWPTNPKVDHLIGRKLSQKYRFTEGARHQQRALVYDPNYLPAKIQLAQDLLRLGEEDAGWELAEQVHGLDGYDVMAYNLVTLREAISQFATVTNEHFIVRMNADEAKLYGDRVLRLLDRAFDTLSNKYGIALETPIRVEIFPEQKDFAVRTFGMPDNPGYLGVCFGKVITMNSPASRGDNPHNWEAILWHEFAHVVTLQMTQNRIPRWLSEGISVYEERQEQAAWGEQMNPQYRQMILGDDYTGIGQLSGLFLSPKTPAHLQFAYYQSSLAVEFLVERYGLDSLTNVLSALAQGGKLEDVLSQYTLPMEALEREFKDYTQARAEQFAPGLSWDRPEGRPEQLVSRYGLKPSDPDTDNGEEDLVLTAPVESAPTDPSQPNYYALLREAASALADHRYEEAKKPLKTLLDCYPNQQGASSAYAFLAAAHRGLKELAEEQQVLEQWTQVDPNAVEAFLRLIELNEGSDNPAGVMDNVDRILAVNPLLSSPYRSQAEAAAATGDSRLALAAWQRVLEFEPPDPAIVHYQIASIMQAEGNQEAKRHVLLSLEEAPRFREAHRLLLKLAIGREDLPPTEATQNSEVAPSTL